ncbi:MAG TPA: biotin/lipoyl-containing protein, partial [Trebonia sp.]|nr:biotin/lipoyl-containing protein [Trebonia sp.]
EVEADAPILVLESMKMETVLRAPFRARVRECLVSVGSQVEAGAPLLRLEPVGDADAAVAVTAGPAAEIDLPAAPAGVPAAERAGQYLADLRGLLLGFDDDPADPKRALTGYLAARAELGGAPLPGEVELLTVFADMSELSRNQPGSDTETALDGPVHSPREYFHSYLRSLDVERAGVPEAFQVKLARVFRYYEVTSLDRTPELEAAVFRIFLAQQRMAADAGVVAELLRQWLATAPPADPLREPAGLALEHLIEATQLRFPSVSDLARGVVFRWFAQPLLRRNRARVYAAIREQLRYLDQHPDAADRAERIQAMVASSEPLVRLIGQRVRRGADNAPLLEVLTRRYYGNHHLADVTARDVAASDGTSRRFVTAEDASRGRVTLVAAAAADIAALPGAVAALGTLAAEATDGSLVADFYVTWAGHPDPDELAARLGELLAASLPSSPAPAARIDRITFTVAGTSGTAMRHRFTFRPGDEAAGGASMAEDLLIRGLHPQIAQRLQMDRLREFDLNRLPSADEEIYLFKAAAKTNKSDERLIAMGQVRDLTPLREADGRLVALPALENVLAGCLDAIRTVQAQRPQHKRFDANRITIYVWPTVDLTVEEINSLVHRVRPTTSGAGLEEVQFVTRQRTPSGDLAEVAVWTSIDASHAVRLHTGPPPTEPLRPLD